jgi:hypothetical protein
MPLLKRFLLISTVAIALSLTLVAVYAGRAEPLTTPLALGIEIAVDKPFYVPAATTDRVTSMFIRVTPAEAKDGSESVSVIRLDPRMENDKVKVTVYALSGSVGDITTCRDWDSLKAVMVGTYVAGLDDEVALSKLQDYGVGVGQKPLTFRVVPKRMLSPLPIFHAPDPCECGTCGGLICCPNPGQCLNCGSCGSFCCKY